MDISVSKKTLIRLAFPLLLETILKNLMSTVNVFMLSSYSDNASAAVGVANQIINVATITFSAVATGSVIIVNQQLGAGKNRDAARTSMNALAFSLILGAAVSALLVLCAKPFLLAMGMQDDLMAPAMTYLRGVGSISVAFAASYIMSALFRSHNNTRTPMIVVAVTNVINALGAWIVVFRPFEQPLEGVEGIVTVRVVSELVGIIILTIALIRAGYGYKLADLIKLDLRTIIKTAKLSVMVSGEGLSYSLGQVVTTSFITGLGAVALSSKVYVQTVSTYTYICGLAIGQAVQIVSGHLIGAGRSDDAYRCVWRSQRWILVFNVLFSLSLYLLRGPIIGLFTSDGEILRVAGTLLLIDVATNAVRSLNHSVKLGLISAGYTFVPMIVAVTSIWILNVGLGWLASTVLGLGIVGLWIGQFADEACRGVVQAFLWKSRRWEAAAVIKK